MRRLAIGWTQFFVCLLFCLSDLRAADPPAGAASPRPELRRPGFLFIELVATHVDDYVQFIEAVAGFPVTDRRDRFVTLESDCAEITIMHPDLLPAGHPFYKKLLGSGQGLGVEIGLVVPDLDAAYANALKFKEQGFKVSAGIGLRPWGVRDFRILTPDGYYLRFTEPPKR
jgi:hypothetical protein